MRYKAVKSDRLYPDVTAVLSNVAIVLTKKVKQFLNSQFGVEMFEIELIVDIFIQLKFSKHFVIGNINFKFKKFIFIF